MVNDTIANALDTIQMKAISYNNDCANGISLPVKNIIEEPGLFPKQEYDWVSISALLGNYVKFILQESK